MITTFCHVLLIFSLLMFNAAQAAAISNSKESLIGQRLSELKKNEVSHYGMDVNYLSGLYESNLRVESLEKERGKFLLVVVRPDKSSSESQAKDGTVVAALDLMRETIAGRSGPQVECNKSVKDKLIVGLGLAKTINAKKFISQPKKAWALDPKTMQFEPISAESVICAPKDPNVVEGY